MATQSINPYPLLGKYTSDGLDDLIKNITGTPTFEDFNNYIESYVIKSLGFGKPKLTEIEITSIVPHAVNNYINSKIESFSIEQAVFIDVLLITIIKTQPLEIPNFISDAEDNISKSKYLTFKERIPLFFVTQIGTTVFNYWLKQITDGKTSPWFRFLNTNSAIDIANLPYWVSAAMQAALFFTYKGDYSTDMKDGVKIAGHDFVTALTASIGLAAGKVIFRWIPRINIPQLSLNKKAIVNLYNLDMRLINDGKDISVTKTVCETACDGTIVAPCGCIRVIEPLPTK
ncbi:MAG: hypothetical protein WC599_03560 [Bacteroidales bacterium]